MDEYRDSYQRESEGKHDCENCPKIPARIEVNSSEDGREYSGELYLGEALFGYNFRFTGNSEDIKTPQELKAHIEFLGADADGKQLQLQDKIRDYLLMLVGDAAKNVLLQTMVARRVTGALEQALGGKVEPIVMRRFASCVPSTPEIKQFVRDYAARGSKA